MKKQTKLNITSAALMAFRLIAVPLLFREFFYFRMVNVACLFIAYLAADSVEEYLVYYGASWNRTKKIICYIIECFLIFAVISNFLLRFPIPYVAAQLGFNMENVDSSKIFSLWLWTSIITFIVVIIEGWAMRKEWGVIQYLLFHFLFFLYCFLQIPLWASAALSVPLICLIAIEGHKHKWNIKEMWKKDIRFRHHKKTAPPLD